MAGSHFSLGRGWKERRQSQWAWAKRMRSQAALSLTEVDLTLSPVPFSECPYLFFDRIALGEWGRGHWLTAAVAVDLEGYRHLLHAYVAGSEDESLSHDLALANAGLQKVGLIIGSQSADHAAQLTSHYGDSRFQFCADSFTQDILQRMPREHVPTIRSLLKMCHMPETLAQSAKEVAKAAAIVAELGQEDVAEHISKLGSASLAYHEFPASHHRFIRSSHVIDRQLRSALKKPYPEFVESLQRDPFAFLQDHVAPNWSRRRYFGMTPLKWLQTSEVEAGPETQAEEVVLEPVHDVLDPVEMIRAEPPLETFSATIEEDPDDHLDWLSLHEMTENDLALDEEVTSSRSRNRKSSTEIIIEAENSLPIGQHVSDSAENELHIDFSETRSGDIDAPHSGNGFTDHLTGNGGVKTKADPANAGFDGMYEGDDAPGRWTFLPDRQVYVRSPGYNRYFIFSRGAQLLSLLGVMLIVGWSSFATLGWLNGSGDPEAEARFVQLSQDLQALQGEHDTSLEALSVAETDLKAMRQTLANYDPDELTRLTGERDSFAERVVALESELSDASREAAESASALELARAETLQFQTVQTDLSGAQETIAELTARVASLQADGEGAAARVANLEAANRSYQQDALEQTDAIRQLNVQLADANAQLEQLKSDLDTERAKAAALEETINTKQAELDVISETQSNDVASLAALQTSFDALTEQNATLVSQTDSLTASLEEQETAASALQDEMRLLVQDHETALQEKDARVELVEKQLESAKQDLANLQEARSENESEAVAALEATLAGLQTEKQDLLADQGNNRQEITRLQADLTRATSALASTGTQLAVAEAALESLQALQADGDTEAQSRIAALEEQNEALENRQQLVASQTSRLEAERQSLTDQVSTLSQTIADLEETVIAARSEADAEKSDLESAKDQQIADLESTIGELERSLNEAQESRRALNDNVAASLAELTSLKSQLQETARAKLALESEISTFKEEQAEVIAASLEPVSSEAEALRAEVLQLKADLETAQSATVPVDDEGVILEATQRIAELEEQLKLAQATAAEAQTESPDTELASLRLQLNDREQSLASVRSQMTAVEDQRRGLLQELVLLKQDSSLEEVTRQRSENERLRSQLEQALSEQAVLNTALDDSKTAIERLLSRFELNLTPPSPRKPQG